MLIPSLPQSIKVRAEKMDMPVVYAEALRALEVCTTIDMAKYYADKADALAAWAKIHGCKKDLKLIARIKLHAYAWMGRIAGELRPVRNGKGKGSGSGAAAGPQSLLMEAGLSASSANAARKLATLSAKKLDEHGDNGLSPSTAHQRSTPRYSSSPEWAEISRECSSTRGCFRRNPARKVALSVPTDEIKKAREMFTEISDWIDEFDRCLPK